MCLLCARPHCEIHKGKEESICEINHVTYFNSHRDFKDIYPGICSRDLGLDKDTLSFFGFENNYLTREQADRILEDRKKASMLLEEEKQKENLINRSAVAGDNGGLGGPDEGHGAGIC